MSESQTNIPSPRVGESRDATVQIKQAQPAMVEQKNRGKEYVDAVLAKVNTYDPFIMFDIFYLWVTWLFLVCQKDSDVSNSANFFAWWVSLVFLLDFMFRLLSVRIESMHARQWNHLWLCLFPILFSMLAALYDYEKAVYGNKPLQVWNALFYTCYLVGTISCAVYNNLN